MAQNLSEEKIKLFESVVRFFNIAIKSSALYLPNHPSVESSIKTFKEILDKWFLEGDRLDLGVSPDNLLLEQEFVKQKDELFMELADYLHQRGIIAISFKKGISLKELIEFFGVIRQDPKFFMQNGGIVKNLSKQEYLEIKELDYSAFLNTYGQSGEVSSDELDIWQQLTSFGLNLKEGQLPDSSFDFVMNFLKDQKKSAPLLNKIYKDALSKLEGKTVIDNFRGTFENMIKYLKEKNPGGSLKIKKELAEIISGLNPDFVASVFTSGGSGSGGMDLSKDFFNQLSDDEMANFMAGLMHNEGKVSENLFKLFDRLAPSGKSSGNLAVILTDKLLEKKLINKNVLSELQLSVKQIFEANSDNEFMSQMYKMTVETFLDQGVSPDAKTAKFSEMIEEYERSLSMDELLNEEVRLILNLLWLENDTQKYKELSQILLSVIDKLNSEKYLNSMRNIFEYCLEKIKAQQKSNPDIAKEIDLVLNKITALDKIKLVISFIPKAAPEGLNDISYIVNNTKNVSIALALDAFIEEKDVLAKEKFIEVISKIGQEVSKSISGILNSDLIKDIGIIKELFRALKSFDPQEARKIAKKFIQGEIADLRNEALEDFIPQDESEMGLIFDILKREPRHEIREKMVFDLVKAASPKILAELFVSGRRLLGKSFLLKFIKLCGELKIQNSLPYLEKVIILRPIFDTENKKQLRIAAVASLAQIATQEARVILKKATTDQSETVRNIAKMALGPQ